MKKVFVGILIGVILLRFVWLVIDGQVEKSQRAESVNELLDVLKDDKASTGKKILAVKSIVAIHDMDYEGKSVLARIQEIPLRQIFGAESLREHYQNAQGELKVELAKALGNLEDSESVSLLNATLDTLKAKDEYEGTDEKLFKACIGSLVAIGTPESVKSFCTFADEKTFPLKYSDFRKALKNVRPYHLKSWLPMIEFEGNKNGKALAAMAFGIEQDGQALLYSPWCFEPLKEALKNEKENNARVITEQILTLMTQNGPSDKNKFFVDLYTDVLLRQKTSYLKFMDGVEKEIDVSNEKFKKFIKNNGVFKTSEQFIDELKKRGFVSKDNKLLINIDMLEILSCNEGVLIALNAHGLVSDEGFNYKALDKILELLNSEESSKEIKRLCMELIGKVQDEKGLKIISNKLCPIATKMIDGEINDDNKEQLTSLLKTIKSLKSPLTTKFLIDAAKKSIDKESIDNDMIGIVFSGCGEIKYTDETKNNKAELLKTLHDLLEKISIEKDRDQHIAKEILKALASIKDASSYEPIFSLLSSDKSSNKLAVQGACLKALADIKYTDVKKLEAVYEKLNGGLSGNVDNNFSKDYAYALAKTPISVKNKDKNEIEKVSEKNVVKALDNLLRLFARVNDNYSGKIKEEADAKLLNKKFESSLLNIAQSGLLSEFVNICQSEDADKKIKAAALKVLQKVQYEKVYNASQAGDPDAFKQYLEDKVGNLSEDEKDEDGNPVILKDIALIGSYKHPDGYKWLDKCYKSSSKQIRIAAIKAAANYGELSTPLFRTVLKNKDEKAEVLKTALSLYHKTGDIDNYKELLKFCSHHDQGLKDAASGAISKMLNAGAVIPSSKILFPVVSGAVQSPSSIPGPKYQGKSGTVDAEALINGQDFYKGIYEIGTYGKNATDAFPVVLKFMKDSNTKDVQRIACLRTIERIITTKEQLSNFIDYINEKTGKFSEKEIKEISDANASIINYVTFYAVQKDGLIDYANKLVGETKSGASNDETQLKRGLAVLPRLLGLKEKEENFKKAVSLLDAIISNENSAKIAKAEALKSYSAMKQRKSASYFETQFNSDPKEKQIIEALLLSARDNIKMRMFGPLASKYLESSDPAIRMMAIQAIMKSRNGEQVFDLLKLFNSDLSTKNEKMTILTALLIIDDKRMLHGQNNDGLIEYIKNGKDIDLVMRALYTIKKFKPKAVVQTLVETLKNNATPDAVKFSICNILAAMSKEREFMAGKLYLDYQFLYEGLRDVIKNTKDNSVKIAAIVTLAEVCAISPIKDKESIDLIGNTLTDASENYFVRQWAAASLGIVKSDWTFEYTEKYLTTQDIAPYIQAKLLENGIDTNINVVNSAVASSLQMTSNERKGLKAKYVAMALKGIKDKTISSSTSSDQTPKTVEEPVDDSEKDDNN